MIENHLKAAFKNYLNLSTFLKKQKSNNYYSAAGSSFCYVNILYHIYTRTNFII